MPNKKWNERYEELRSFIESNDRQPDLTTDSEKSLALWVAAQKTARNTGKMSKEQEDKLNELNGWTWAKKSQPWDNRLSALKDFQAKNGRMPNINSEKETEKKLAQWVNNQKIACRNGRLSKERSSKLLAVPGFSIGRRRDSPESYRNVILFFIDNGRLPDKDSTDDAERALAQIVDRVQKSSVSLIM